MFAQSLSPRVARRRPSLRRDAPLYSDLCLVVRRPSRGDSGRTSRSHNGQVKIRLVSHDQSRLLSDDHQIHGLLSNQTVIYFWLCWVADLRGFISLRRFRVPNEVRQLAASRRLYSNAFAGPDHGVARVGSAVFFHGFAGGDVGADLSRIAGEAGVCGEGADWIWKQCVIWSLVLGLWSLENLKGQRPKTKGQDS